MDIERNDSGLGSETGNKAVVMVKQRARSSALSKVGNVTKHGSTFFAHFKCISNVQGNPDGLALTPGSGPACSLHRGHPVKVLYNCSDCV